MRRRAGRRAVAWSGGGLAGVAAAAFGVLVAQATSARRAIGPQRGVPPYQDGRFGPATGISIRLAIIGDSVAAGLGAGNAAETVSGVLVRWVGAATGRPVVLTNHAVIGARSADLARQVARCLGVPPDVAIIIIGANDVTHMVPRGAAARRLAEAITALRGAGVNVVVGTCPDLGTVRPVGPPLKWVARHRSRALARAQRRASTRAGAAPVNLYDLLGPEFHANADALFASDRFHPSGLGYRRIGAVLLPEVLLAVGVKPGPRHREIKAGPVDPGTRPQP